ncbi:MAG: M28 family peptidase [Chloroherpetonaceae bacterium]|nr:M28 family peptidase [Chloroherpetonaceae bacterium]MDW8437879.1 M28 family peptidase [Chloroherpetonaceae bacterium]
MRFIVSLIFVLWASCLLAQSSPEFSLPFNEPAAHIKFLASDELGGRMTGEHGNDVAARYIASRFLRYGLKPLAPNYLQPVPFIKRSAPNDVALAIGDKTFSNDETLLLSGEATRVSAPVVYAGFGIVDSATGRDDYKGINAKGKIVVARIGTSEDDSPRELFGAFQRKQEIAKAKGALALVELYRFGFPLSRLKSLVGRTTLALDDGSETQSSFPHLLLNDDDSQIRAFVESEKKLAGKLETDGYKKQKVISNNVVGTIEGTDARLKDEYVLLSAHYDHIGIQPTPNSDDSIYNGARDNAMGTTALLCAARVFGESPPKRSVIFLACTGEEMGLLGSKFYAEHPLVPLNKVVFNLNVDGAGYNDTSVVTVIGLERSTAEQDLIEACKAFGLEAIQDPAPEQNLFDRSDNVSFAKKGVPALTFSPGFRAFDDAINKYYHQAADQADEHFDFRYFHRFVKAFIWAARRIADNPNAPRWKAGDKYETASQRLYGR